MPFLGWSISRMFKLNTAQALGVIVVCSAPGGSFSNFFCYHTGENLGLPIAMTMFSTFSAFGMMPLMTWLWADFVDGFEDHEEMGNSDMNYWGLVLTLIAIMAPIGLDAFIRSPNWGKAEAYGWCCRWIRRPRWYWLNILSGIGGVSFIVLALVVGVLRYGKFLFKNWQIVIAGSLVTPVGSAFGFIVAKLCRLPYKEALTVCWETGLQNLAIAIGLIDLSFEDGGSPDKEDVLKVPLDVAIFYNIEVAIMCIFFKFIDARYVRYAGITMRKDINAPI